MPDPTSIPTSAPITVPPVLFDPFEEPHLLIIIDKTNPTTTLGKQFIARLSSTHSSLFSFDIRPKFAGKTCNLVFHLPATTSQRWQPFNLVSPGGISVSQLEKPATETTSFGSSRNSRPVGSVDQLTSGLGHLVSSGPCEAGKSIGYRVDALNGLHLDYFQMVTPAAGLFMTVSD